MTDPFATMTREQIATCLEDAYLEPLPNGTKRTPAQVNTDIENVIAYKTAILTYKTKGLTLKEGIRFKDLGEQEVDAFFLGLVDRKEWPKDKSQGNRPVVVGKKPLLLLADGSIFGNEDKEVATGDFPDTTPRLAPVKVSGINVTQDIYLHTYGFRATPKTAARSMVHDSPIPPVSCQEGLMLANTVDEKAKIKRGAIRGESGFNSVYATMTVGPVEDVTYFPPGQFDESLRVKATDASGQRYEVDVNAGDWRAQLAIPPTATKDDFIRLSANRRIFVGGKVKVFQEERLAKMAPQTAASVMDDINLAIKQGRSVVYKNDEKAGPLMALVMGTPASEHEPGGPYVRVGGYRCYDVRQEAAKDEATGEYSIPTWKPYVLRSDKQELPVFDAKRKLKRDGSGEWGGWCIVLDTKMELPEDDPFAQFAKGA